MYDKVFIYRHTVSVVLDIKFQSDLDKLKEAYRMLAREIIKRGGEDENHYFRTPWSPSGL